MPALDASPQAPAIVVVGTRADNEIVPNTKESVDAARLRETVNVRNTEDALRYFPSLFVRKRHIGDTQAPLTTRTSGVGASARALVYADACCCRP
jgi:iron complex outermembrane receptor protein